MEKNIAQKFIKNFGSGAFAALFSLVTFSPSAFAVPGDLDPAFGTGGKVTTGTGFFETVNSLALQSDGKIIAAGSSTSNFMGDVSGDLLVVRYTRAGVLDTTFGSAGKAFPPSGLMNDDACLAVAIQSDGKILAAGKRTINGTPRFLVVRFNADGSPDDGSGLDSTPGNSFGTGGAVTTLVGDNCVANAMVLQNDGKILVAGFSSTGGNRDFMLARYTTAGVLDSDFNNGAGFVTTNLTGNFDIATCIALQSDGNILLGGSAFSAGTNDDIALVRYTSSGGLDLAFGSGTGKVIRNLGPNDQASQIALQSDGRIVVAVRGTDFTVARFNTNGSLDDGTGSDSTPGDSFGVAGVRTTVFSQGASEAKALAVMGDNRIVLGGTVTVAVSNRDFAVARYTANGLLDTTFGNSGTLATAFATGTDDISRAIAIQADGQILAAGESIDAGVTDSDYALVRYDLLTLAPTLVQPAANISVTSSINVNFTLPEPAKNGTLKLGFGATQLTLAASEQTAGPHTFFFDAANPTSSPKIASGNAIADGIYNVTLNYQDLAGNPVASVVNQNVRVDTLAPIFTLPATITVEATSPAGAVVSYTASASDQGGSGVGTSSFSPASGSTFPVGTTVVGANAVDFAGNESSDEFSVIVRDTTAPQITAPNITATATSANGAVVNFTVNAQDIVDGTIAAQTVPASGSTFPIGKTTVNVTATDTRGNSSTSSFTLTVQGGAFDTVAPVVIVTSPTATTVAGTFNITGTVKENIALNTFSVSLNGTPLTLDAPLTFSPNAVLPWAVTGVTPENGPNVIIVDAVDFSGRITRVTRKVTFINTAIAGRAGTYNAVFMPVGTPSTASTALLNVKLGKTGTFSGSVQLSGVKIPLKGVIQSDGTARFLPNLALSLPLKKGTLTLGLLEFSITDAAGLAGNIVDAQDTIIASGSGRRAPYSSKAPVPLAFLNQPVSGTFTKGIYNIAFPSKPQPPLTAAQFPQGHCFASLKISRTGKVTYAGKLADGTKLAGSTLLRADGSALAFAQLYSKRGVFAGDLAFSDLPDSDVVGNGFVWIRPPQTTVRHYPAGWPGGLRVNAIGTKWAAPTSFDFSQGATNLATGNAGFLFRDGLISTPIVQPVNVDPGTFVATTVPATGAAYTISTNKNTGQFNGTFTHSDGKQPAFQGIILNKGGTRAGAGFFLSVPAPGSTGQAGLVILDPAGP